jgi:hypothetical protein
MGSSHANPSDAPPPCIVHSFEAVQIHAGGYLTASLPADKERGQLMPRTLAIEATACVDCGAVALRVKHPGLLRSLLKATEQQGKGTR